jgi:glycosyltransferase involved in cell wall biosynthesis
VLFVGRLSEHKGARLLPDIARRVLDQEPEARVIIAGGGPEEEAVAAALGSDARVALLGYVPNPEVPALMHAADVLVMPSLEEGFPRRLLEAMAAGLPFVAADVGGVREVIPDAAQPHVVPAGDPARFAEAVVALLRDPDQRAELSRAGRAHVERYAVTRVAPLFLDAVTG